MHVVHRDIRRDVRHDRIQYRVPWRDGHARRESVPRASDDGVAGAGGVTGPRHDEDLRLVRDSLAGVGGATDALVDRLGCVPPILSSLNRQMGSQLQSRA